MSASVSELATMEDHPAGGDEEKLPDDSLSATPTSIPSSAPHFPTTARPISTSETVTENKAVSLTSNECSSALSSPAEASPAKPAGTATTSDGTAEASPATSGIASASDSLKCTERSRVDLSEPPPSSSSFPSSAFGCQDPERDFPAVLTFQGISVTLESNSVWKKFCSCGTEMILTKPGRRMFPYCRYRLSGLDPKRQYSLVLSIVPSNQHRYRRNGNKWEVSGPAEHHFQGLIRAFSHQESPNVGSFWMGSMVSFYKLKLTNNFQDQEGHIILQSMQRYIPRLHVIPVPDGGLPAVSKGVVMGPESMAFTFPQTEFIAVTSYQNFQITQLKIDHNPFARGFREDGHNSRLQRFSKEHQPQGLKLDITPDDKVNDMEDEVVDLSLKAYNAPAPLPNLQKIRLVLKPIMSNPGSKAEPFTPCIRGNYALGELMLVEKPPLIKPKEEETPISVTPEEQEDSEEFSSSKSRSVTPVSSSSTPTSSPVHRKKRRKINRRWANSRGRDWKPAAASSAAVQSLPPVSMQPVMDDVEGLLFASFTSKEALQVHIKDKPTTDASPTPFTPTTPSKETIKLKTESDGEKITRLELVLLNDLSLLKHRQVIHPVLQEVGLKLSSLDPLKPIDLQYLGVCLPLPPPNLPEQTALSFADERSSFISRTGKTSDMTKIKGWKTKFMGSKEPSLSNCEGSQKNLSAFCSNMLDEYLESEAQQITERAAAFSTSPEGSVAYQLPAKSSSYVKTLDSALKHRNSGSNVPVRAIRPCPLSHKPLLYSALTSPPPPLGSPAASKQAAVQCRSNSSSSHLNPVAKSSTKAAPIHVSQSASMWKAGLSQKPAARLVPNQEMTRRLPGLTKYHLKMMETGTQNQGLNKTKLTEDRLSVALSVLLTKETQFKQCAKVALFPQSKFVGAQCGQVHCRLGCVCPSAEPLNHRLHCKQPECMFSCACKTIKEEAKQQLHPADSMTNVVQPRPGSHTKKLWSHNNHDKDPEPLSTPRSTFLPGEGDSLHPRKVPNRTTALHVAQPVPMREEDKDPVYKYLESMMTCARVRAIYSVPPPQVTLQQSILAASAQNAKTTLPQNPPGSQNRNNHSTLDAVSTKGETSQETTYNEKEAKKQIQIQSMCPWQKDRKMVLGALCLRMKNNQLCKRFCVGPYCINPVSKIYIRKLSGSIITYRIRISKRPIDSDYDEDDEDDSGEEEEPEEGEIDGSELLFGVTPFLSGVLPAGRLRVRKKSVGVQEQGLVQVNGKCYNHARLMLGNIGSLHPANRLAAFVTGRLKVPSILQKKSEEPDKQASSGSQNLKPADSVVPPVITEEKTPDPKTPPQPHGQMLQPDQERKGSTTCPQITQFTCPTNLLASSSVCSGVSLTVSPSLKRPSFLEESGTYSFRISPPSSQGAEGQKLPGVYLPGGFTLIQLPKPRADGAAQLSVAAPAAPMRKNGALRFSQLAAEWLGSNTFSRIQNLLTDEPAQPGPSSETVSEETEPSENSDEANERQEDSNLDDSDDLSSDSSDYEEEDDAVDIESIEESQEKAIAQMRADVLMKIEPSCFLSDEVGGADQTENKPKEKRRLNHTVLERVRRSEQRVLFSKLQHVLQCDPRSARLTVLSQAHGEIRSLVQTSRVLEQRKKLLTEKQSAYIKRLSSLSGKTESQIKNKLMEICKKQKTMESSCKPFLSHLLQSRAAQLQASASLSNPKLSTQRHEGQTSSQGDVPMIPAHNNIRQMMYMLQPHLKKALTESCENPTLPVPQPLLSPTLAKVSVPTSHMEIEPGEVVEAVQVSLPLSNLKDSGDSEKTNTSHTKMEPQSSTDKTTPHNSNAQNAQLPAWLTKTRQKAEVPPSKPVTLPLIRSKTGRLILPSCLKPLGNGLYTLTVLNGEAGEVSSSSVVQPSATGVSEDEEKHPPESEQSADSESSSSDSEDNDAPSDSTPKTSGVSNPLAELVVLNQSIAFPSKASGQSQELLTNTDMNKIIAAARLTFKQVCHSPVTSKPEPDRSSVVQRRPKAFPRIKPAEPTHGNERHSKDNENGKASENANVAPGRTGMKAENSVSVKRGRGRPPKRRSQQHTGPGVPSKRAASWPSKQKDDDPTIVPYSSKNSRTTGDASRPMTRGALGKDFPSAKKRSWIDVEKELEPDMD